MSYARFGVDGSDVYVFTSSLGLECCFCHLQERVWKDEANAPLGGWFEDVGEHVQDIFASNEGMIAHLETHVAAGHNVPDYTFERLRDPADAAENQRIWRERAA